jgi:hypothetical protein
MKWKETAGLVEKWGRRTRQRELQRLEAGIHGGGEHGKREESWEMTSERKVEAELHPPEKS